MSGERRPGDQAMRAGMKGVLVSAEGANESSGTFGPVHADRSLRTREREGAFDVVSK